MYSGALGTIKAAKQRTCVKEGTVPRRQQPYQAGAKSREVLWEHIWTQLDAGIIALAQTEWESTVLLGPINEGTIQFCVGFRRLKATTILDTLPLLWREHCINSLEEAKVFATLDVFRGYWQVPIVEDDRDGTTSTSHVGIYRHSRMRF